MREFEGPGEQAYLSRTEVEIELARLALVVMRAAPDTFEEMGHRTPSTRCPEDELPLELASRLLARTRPDHRPFVEARLLELARCLAGIRTADAHEWLNLTLDLPERHPVETRLPPPREPERRGRR